MRVSEKHRETARDIVGENHRWIGPSEAIELLARAIAAGESEGMNRAADELDALVDKRKREGVKRHVGNGFIASCAGYLRHRRTPLPTEGE